MGYLDYPASIHEWCRIRYGYQNYSFRCGIYKAMPDEVRTTDSIMRPNEHPAMPKHAFRSVARKIDA